MKSEGLEIFALFTIVLVLCAFSYRPDDSSPRLYQLLLQRSYEVLEGN